MNEGQTTAGSQRGAKGRSRGGGRERGGGGGGRGRGEESGERCGAGNEGGKTPPRTRKHDTMGSGFEAPATGPCTPIFSPLTLARRLAPGTSRVRLAESLNFPLAGLPRYFQGVPACTDSMTYAAPRAPYRSLDVVIAAVGRRRRSPATPCGRPTPWSPRAHAARRPPCSHRERDAIYFGRSLNLRQPHVYERGRFARRWAASSRQQHHPRVGGRRSPASRQIAFGRTAARNLSAPPRCDEGMKMEFH
jgi:hypothetical protein